MAGPPTKASPEKNEALCPDSYGSSEILLWSAASSCLVERKKNTTRTNVSILSGTSGKAADQIQWCVSDCFVLLSNAKQL